MNTVPHSAHTARQTSPLFHVLVVDDDSRIRSLLKKFLQEHRYVITTAGNTEEADLLARLMHFDVMILDVMMPGENGLHYAKRLRSSGNDLPIIMLTAMGEVEDRITGFEHGVDDYLSKPFEPKELLLRIASILKRAYPSQFQAEIRFGPWRFEFQTRKLFHLRDQVPLTDMEAQLLLALASNKRTAISREKLAHIISQTSPKSSLNDRSVDVMITRLRQKMEPHPKDPLYIKTVRGVGYMLVA